ncbi:MAG: hypothetical protein U0R17_01775 [Acidimicrobiia bacterium]
MQTPNIVNKITTRSKIFKLNILLLITFVIAATMTVSFATEAQQTNCGARVALVLDRSSSIGVDQFSGGAAQSEANVAAIKNGAMSFVDALKGPDSYMDVYAFASVAQRINSGGWFKLDGNFNSTTTNVDLQKFVIGTTKFKRGATSSSENAYNDGMTASSEGLTNWNGALNLVGASRQDPFPTHLVIFTDGNPTTNQSEVDKALAAGGSFAASGQTNVDGVDADDISTAVASANFLRAIGIKIIPIAVGAEGIVNMANLQALAGAGNPVYRANDYSQLTNMFKQAAANICVQPKPTTINVNARDTDGNLISVPVNVGTTGTDGGPSAAGDNRNTPTDPNNQWTSWSFKTLDNWRARITQTAVPAGYVPVKDFCRREALTNPDLPQREGTENSPSNIIMDPIQPGGNIYCQFVLKKLTDGIQILKDVTPTTAKRGEAVTYSFVVKNTGNTKLTNIKITDPMLGGQVGTIASLEPGASSAPITKTYTIPNNATGTIHNVATATGTPVNPDGSVRPEVKDDDPADVVVQLRQGQTIEKSVTPEIASVGTEVTYTISVKNTGEGPLSNVVVTDATLGKEVTIAGPIAPGATGATQIKYTIKQGDFKDGVFTNVACIKGTQTCDDAKVKSPQVELTKSGPATAKPGDKVKYTFTVKNVGVVDLTNIKIKDDTLSKYTSSPVVIEIPGTLKPGQTSEVKTYEFTIPKDFKENSFKNVAVVHSNPVDPTTGNPITGTDVTDDDDHVIGLSRWVATKTADKSVVVPGTEVTYTISVKNTGAVDLSNIEVSDATIGFPADGKPVVIASLKVGETKSVTAKYTIPANFTGKTFKNTALVCVDPKDGSTVDAGVSSADCQEPTATVDVAKIAITKTADKETALPGDKVIYTFVVENTGNVSIDPTPINDNVLGVIGDPGILKPGEKATFTKEYIVPKETKDGTSIKNIATVCAPVPGTTSTVTGTDCVTTCPASSLTTLCAQDDHTLLVQVPSIKIDKTADKTTANVGDSVVYTFVVTNTSKVTLTDISVTDNVLGDLGKIDKLEPGASATKSVTYVVPSSAAAAGSIRNVATACFATPKVDTNCASDDHTLSVTQVLGTSVTRPPSTVSNTLAFTGAQSGWLALVAGLIVGLGATLFMITRKRKGEAL